MKHNLFALGLISILTGLAGPHSGVAQDSSGVLHRQSGQPLRRRPGRGGDQVLDRGPGATATSRTCRATAPASGTPMS
jgi:hypothetical protein